MAAREMCSPFALPMGTIIEEMQTQAEQFQMKEAMRVAELQAQEAFLKTFNSEQSDLIERLKSLKETLKALHEDSSEHQSADPVCQKCPKDVSADKQKYDWVIRPLGQIPSLLRKGKYVRFQVCLQSLKGVPIPTDLTVPVSISVLASDQTSTPILESVTGEPIIRGQVKSEFRFDASKDAFTARFKMQFTAVSSHFVNGWVRLAIQAEKCEGVNLHSLLIQPLVIENVVVRAKEKTCILFREREQKGMPQQRVQNLLGSPSCGEGHLKSF